jgi:hypothetical protein
MLGNFIQESATNPGTSTNVSLNGAATGRLAFLSVFNSGQSCFYVMDDGAQQEWGIGSVTSGNPNVLARTTVLGNSLGTTARLNFTGAVRVYNAMPAERAIWKGDTGLAAKLTGVSVPVELSRLVANNVGSLTFHNLFNDAVYERYDLVLRALSPADDDAMLRLRIGTGGGPTIASGATDYQTNVTRQSSSGGTPASAPDGGLASGILLSSDAAGFGVGNAAGERISGVIRFDAPQSAVTQMFEIETVWIRPDGTPASFHGVGFYGAAAAITAVRLQFDTGNIASGVASLIGWTRAA